MLFGGLEPAPVSRSTANRVALLAGWYCAVEGLDAPTGQCNATYYCGGGAVVATPDSMSADGYQGDTCVDRSNGTTNDICPPGHYCPRGTRRW